MSFTGMFHGLSRIELALESIRRTKNKRLAAMKMHSCRDCGNAIMNWRVTCVFCGAEQPAPTV